MAGMGNVVLRDDSYKHLREAMTSSRPHPTDADASSQIDAAECNLMKQHGGKGQALTLLIPAGPSVPFDLYTGGCENTLDTCLLEVLRRGGEGVLVEARGSVSNNASERERHAFDQAPPRHWARYFLGNGGLNSFTKQTWDRGVEEWENRLTKETVSEIKKFFQMLSTRKPKAVIVNCRMGQARGPGTAAIVVLGVCRALPPSTSSEDIASFIHQVRNLSTLRTTIDEHMGSRLRHEQRHKQPHMQSTAFLDLAGEVIQQAARDNNLGDEQLGLPEVLPKLVFLERAMGILVAACDNPSQFLTTNLSPTVPDARKSTVQFSPTVEDNAGSRVAQQKDRSRTVTSASVQDEREARRKALLQGAPPKKKAEDKAMPKKKKTARKLLFPSQRKLLLPSQWRLLLPSQRRFLLSSHRRFRQGPT